MSRYTAATRFVSHRTLRAAPVLIDPHTDRSFAMRLSKLTRAGFITGALAFATLAQAAEDAPTA